ncbi:hypothetical protein BGZ76_011396 [Entomortierella beljakovae]|nr:hypothetical protein BGZ76_011396 [Entomortierella beljakovae]
MKFSISLAIIVYSAIAVTQAAPTKTEPLAGEVPDAVVVPLPIRTCGPPIVDSAGRVVKRFMCPGNIAEGVEVPEKVAAAVVPSPSPTRHCTGGPIHDRRRKRGMECPM